jgi:glycosyltransferase 2 family protein
VEPIGITAGFVYMGTYLLRSLGVFATALGAFLLYRVVQRYDFSAILDALTRVAPTALLVPVGLVVLSYLSLTITEYIGVLYATRRRLKLRRVALITLGSLGIGHAIGLAALSSGAVRLRMYSRSGIGVEAVARIMLFSAANVAMGFTTLIAIGLVVNHRLVIEVLDIERGSTLVVAAALVSVPLLYVTLCLLRRRPLRLRQFRLPLPHPGMGALQIVMGSTNLLLKAAVLFACINLFAETDYLTVASLYVAGDAASVIGHVPGGWGVLEFIVLHHLSGTDAAAGLLVFRVIYYLAPLLLGLGIFVTDEILRRRQGDGRPDSADTSESPPLRYVPNVSHR